MAIGGDCGRLWVTEGFAVAIGGLSCLPGSPHHLFTEPVWQLSGDTGHFTEPVSPLTLLRTHTTRLPGDPD